MDKRLAWSIIVVVVLIGLAALVFFSLQKPEEDIPLPVDVRDRSDSTTDAKESTIIIHSFEDGIHQYAGNVEIPTPCHALDANALVAESFPEQITIQLTTVAPDPDTVCIQVLDRADFEVSASASEEARLVGVTLDGGRLLFDIFEESKG